MKTSYGQVLLVDNGGFFPEEDNRRDAAWFLMDAMKTLGTDAVNVGERDLRFGRAFLEQRARKSGLPVVSANLLDKKTRRPIFSPYLIKRTGGVTVGIFGLITNKGELGPGKDSLLVDDPLTAARNTVIELRRKGAQVIVLLSQLGKVEGEDLVTAVEGIDAIEMGRNVMLIQRGRMVKNTIACYGGEQGQYIGRTVITLNAARAQATGDCEAFMLSPEVGERAEMAKLVKAFEDGFNERLRKLQMERQAEAAKAKTQESPDRFLGAELCIRCHQSEGEQWKTTSHSVAWKTLVDASQDSKPECVSCHVVGYRKAGGFQSAADAPKLVDVQCESCHGMGTMHEAFANPHRTVTEQVCVSCHQGDNDPHWSWPEKRSKILHSNLSGETLKQKKLGPGTMAKPSGSQ